MLRHWVAAVAATLLWSAAPAPAAAQLAVAQLVTQLRPDDGPVSLVIDVRNDGELPVSVAIALNDWQVEEDGRHRFLPAGTLPDSCGDRLRSTETAVRIEAGATAAIRLVYDGAATDRCRNIVFFRVTERPAVLEGDQLIISTGVKVYVER